MRADHPFLRHSGALFGRQPFRTLKGFAGGYIAYPIAESREKRSVRPKIAELRQYYGLPLEARRRIAIDRLVDTLEFAGASVPYYRDLFAARQFDPQRVRDDVRHLDALPYLTKDIIRDQGDRLLSVPLDSVRHHVCKTGGSTGLSCTIFYDQDGADYSSAVTFYARERIGKLRHRFELHFACRFPDDVVPEWPSREDFKCFAMNRSNIFFDRIDDAGLEEMWRTLKSRRPYLAHSHPSTMYALACYVQRKYGGGNAFAVFESSGELLEPHAREVIASALRCRVIDRYGLAELGVMAYELDGHEGGFRVMDSEGWPESRPVDGGADGAHELVFTGFRNRLMPLIRYATGDLARVQDDPVKGFVLTDVVGRIHDVVPINGIAHPTHHIQDMLDHRVGGIQEFQIDLRTTPPTLRIVLEPWANADDTTAKLRHFWGDAFTISFVGHDDLVRVGRRAKFRHVVTA
ncbi:phenylacetate--CoA ligase family protein [Burkholderia cenocepacia]|uniref:phenylacetate--CoA ligase family protein n=1 Tax=Burkholderia TaxID=32008 RepID=UPI00078D93FB|nr:MULTISPECIES: phenylacetate--CoA ligase family protein [Burkholderia]AMU15705.1 CoF synthetase [Burkholderia cenocepacia]MBG0862257.1 phenylacetate--CoA ligase family protein [Burkholderia sp. 9779_493]MBJ9691712.1 phenylacetate--CoA ligase family protein [Burkholderia cenocepacia]MBR7907228.1 phenylacetate--CoA ligase family protein [Burkholderia cenocepacia]MBR8023185.1 phenylacetate--CoA ligase family protein [Burkholderia cenocepacia]